MPYWFLIKKNRNKNAKRQITKTILICHSHLAFTLQKGARIWSENKVGTQSAQLQGKESSVETFVGLPIETPALVSQTLSNSYNYFHNFAKYIGKRAYRESYLLTEKS